MTVWPKDCGIWLCEMTVWLCRDAVVVWWWCYWKLMCPLYTVSASNLVTTWRNTAQGPGVKMHISHTFLMSFNEANHDWIESFILLLKLLNKSIFSCSIAASRRTWTRIKEKKCWSCSWSENNSRLALLPLRELRLEPMRSFGLNIFTQYICDNIVCTDCFIIYWRWPLHPIFLIPICTKKQIVLGNNQIDNNYSKKSGHSYLIYRIHFENIE